MSERFFGLYRGICVNNQDPEGLNRIRATVPTVYTDPGIQTDWAWPMIPPGLSLTPPLPNSGVWVGFEGGDPQYPYWSGVWSNAATAAVPYDPLGAAAAALVSAEAFATTVANAAQAASDPLGSAALALNASETYTNSRSITGIVTSVSGQNCWLAGATPVPAIALSPYTPQVEDIAVGFYAYSSHSATPQSILYLTGAVQLPHSPFLGNPAGHATMTVNNNFGNAGVTQVTSTSSDFLRGGVTYASNQFTVPVAGLYLCAASLGFNPSSSSSTFYIGIFHNGGQTTAFAAFPYISTMGGEETICFVTDLVLCAAGDTLSWGGESTAGSISTSFPSRCRMSVFLASI